MARTDNLAWTNSFHHLMACVDRPKMLLQKIYNHVCTTLYGVLTQTTLCILTIVSTSNPIPKITENWNFDGNVILGKLNYRKAAIQFYIVFNITYFFHQPCTLIYIMSQKNWGNKPFSIKIHILWSGPNVLNFKLFYNYTTRKLNFWSWNKTAYITMKDKEDCSRSEVPFVVLIISMTVGTQNEAQLFHLNFTIFWHNPTAPSCACLILARFLQLSCQKLGSWIILAVELVTLQVLCYWPKNNSPVGKVSSIWWIFLKFPDCSNSLCLLYTVWGLLCSSIIPHDRCSWLCLLIA